MIEPYLPTDEIIYAKNRFFIIKESEDGYELWQHFPRIWLLNGSKVNDFREEIGTIYEITKIQ